NRNILRVMNRSVGSDFVLERFEHVARWDTDEEWIEMRLRSTVDQDVWVPPLGNHARFARDEEMRTEISAKFRRAGVEAELAATDLELAYWWTDAAGDFALSLSFKS